MGLAADVLEVLTIRAVGKEYSPPLAVAVLHEVGMTGTGNGIGTVLVQSNLCKDGVALV